MKERNKRIAYGVLGYCRLLQGICCTDRYAFYDYAHPH